MLDEFKKPCGHMQRHGECWAVLGGYCPGYALDEAAVQARLDELERELRHCRTDSLADGWRAGRLDFLGELQATKARINKLREALERIDREPLIRWQDGMTLKYIARQALEGESK